MAGRTGVAMPDITPLSSHDPRSVGPYRLLGRLGVGGQGVVYLGQDGTGQRVAVKVINNLSPDPRAKSRFAREIAAARRVASFCTAQILFAEVDGDSPYVVSEFIQGPTLHRHVREQGPIAGNALHRLAVGIATALTTIHRSDVIHCDLKPDNVILGADGPRVIDFGIARALDLTETMTKQIMGTAAYMAPERFRNHDVGPASDVFAWAATIAYAASGRPPFGNDSISAVMQRVLYDPPDLPGLPDSLHELIRECLHKDQGARPTAEQVLLRLLGYTARPATAMPLEAVLREGNVRATAPVPAYPPADQPAHTTPAPTAPASMPAHTTPASTAPASAQTVPTPSGPAPTLMPPSWTQPEPVRRNTWSRRLRREYADGWGISTAIFLGMVGTAAGYAASVEVGTAAIAGVVTFVVVYGVRVLVATALGDRPEADPGVRPEAGSTGTPSTTQRTTSTPPSTSRP
ncbi:protein kinase domain-containing protein [Micromonospora sp. NPDC003197]